MLSCGQVGFTLSIFNEASRLTYQSPPGYLIPACSMGPEGLCRPLAAAGRYTRCLSEGTSQRSSLLTLTEAGMSAGRGQVSRQINSWALGTFGTVSSPTLLRPLGPSSPFGFSLNLLLSFLNYLLALPAPRCARLSPQSVSKHPSYTALAPLLSAGSATALSHALVLPSQWVQ